MISRKTRANRCMSAGRKTGDKLYIFLLGLLFLSCQGKNGGDKTVSRSEKIKLQQYMVSGRQLYIQHCSNCHQREGQGLARLYPPLDTSDFMDNRLNSVICLIRYGITGEIVVNGITYNQPMPAIPQLSNLEIAEITTYVYNSWGRNKGLVDVKTVNKVIDTCGKTE